MALHDSMCRRPDKHSVPATVQRFIDELNAKYGYANDEESGFLSVAPLDGELGARWCRRGRCRCPATALC